jgi:hypothetical protein
MKVEPWPNPIKKQHEVLLGTWRLLDGEAKERLSLQIRFTFAVISSSSASHFFCDPVWIPPNIEVCLLGYFQKA